MDFHRNVLTIKKGALSFLSTFASELEDITTQKILKALHPAQPSPSYQSLADIVPHCLGKPVPTTKGNKPELCTCCQSGDQFHNGTGPDHSYYCERYHVKSFIIKRTDNQSPLEVDVFLSIFKNLNIAHLVFNIPVQNIEDKDLIFLKHRFYEPETKNFNKWPRPDTDYLLSHPENKIVLDDYRGILKDLCFELIMEIKHNLPIKKKINNDKERMAIIDELKLSCPSLFNYAIIEIQDIGPIYGENLTRPLDRVIKQYGNNLYGLLTSDEGFEYVPSEVVTQRLNNRWGSRNFTSCFAFGSNALLLNLKNSCEAGRQYIRMQQSRTNCTEINSTYFCMNPCIAGLDHGILSCVEKSKILYFELAYAYSLLSIKTDSQQLHMISKLHRKRQQIIHLLNESHLMIAEMDDLFSLVCQQNGVLRSFEEIKFQLDLRTEDLSFSYQENNDNLIKYLTYITAGISLLAIVNETILNQDKIHATPSIEETTFLQHMWYAIYYSISPITIFLLLILLLLITKRLKARKQVNKLINKLTKTPKE